MNWQLLKTLARENLTTEYGVPAGSVKESFMEKLQTLKDQMKETTLLEETAEDEAEKILKDLNLENMQLLSSDKILWYAQSDYPEATILEQEEALWNADPNLGKTGYRLTYVPSVSGLKINQDKSGYLDDSGFAYAPSMPVEQIYIVVTEDGIRSFKWKGMSQEERVVTENVKLLAFDEIESRLIDQVKYLYPSSQPAEDKTVFGYDVATVELGYTYIPAYKNPQNVWVRHGFHYSESTNTTAELGTAGRKKEYQTDYIVLNATDGGRIGCCGDDRSMKRRHLSVQGEMTLEIEDFISLYWHCVRFFWCTSLSKSSDLFRRGSAEESLVMHTSTYCNHFKKKPCTCMWFLCNITANIRKNYTALCMVSY